MTGSTTRPSTRPTTTSTSRCRRKPAGPGDALDPSGTTQWRQLERIHHYPAQSACQDPEDRMFPAVQKHLQKKPQVRFLANARSRAETRCHAQSPHILAGCNGRMKAKTRNGDKNENEIVSMSRWNGRTGSFC